jgi:hypothetical protein
MMAMIPAVLGIPTHILLALGLVAMVGALIGVFSIPSFFGLPLYVYIGMILGVLIPLQIALAKRWLPIDFKWHRRNGLAIFYVGLIHATIAIGAYLFHVKVQGF